MASGAITLLRAVIHGRGLDGACKELAVARTGRSRRGVPPALLFCASAALRYRFCPWESEIEMKSRRSARVVLACWIVLLGVTSAPEARAASEPAAADAA